MLKIRRRSLLSLLSLASLPACSLYCGRQDAASALLAAIQNPASDGKLDLSQLFATATPGSQIDLQA